MVSVREADTSLYFPPRRSQTAGISRAVLYGPYWPYFSKSAACIDMQTRKKLHGRVLEKIFLFSLFILSYTLPCKIWNLLSPIAPFLKSFGESRAHCRKEEIVFYTRNLENLDRPNFVSASRTLYMNSFLVTNWPTIIIIVNIFWRMFWK